MKRVEVDYPDQVYATLATLAAARGTTVTDVIHGEGILLARRAARAQEVLELYNEGLEVREIARRLDITNTAVRAQMTQLGLRSTRT